MKIKLNESKELLIKDSAVATFEINNKTKTIELSLVSGEVIENSFDTFEEFEIAKIDIHKQMNILNSNLLPNVLDYLRNISNCMTDLVLDKEADK